VNIRWPLSKTIHPHWIGINLSTLAPSAIIYSPDGILSCASFDQEQGVEALGQWIASNAKAGMSAVLVLDDDDYELLLAEAPNVPDEELTAALEFRIGDLLAQPLEDTAIQAIRLPQDAYRGRMSMAHVVAAPNTKIRAWVEWADKLHLKVDMITVPELSLLNILVANSVSQGIAVLELGPKQGSIRIYQEGALYLTRPVEVGLEVLDLRSGDENSVAEAMLDTEIKGPNDAIIAVHEVNLDELIEEEIISDELALDSSDIELDLDEGAIDLEENAYVGFAPKAKVNEQQMQSLVLDVQRSLDYYESQLGMGQITQLWLMSGDRDLTDLIEAMQPALTAKIEQPDIADKLQKNTNISISTGCGNLNNTTLALGGALAYVAS
jgi:MSHA biogenesis protein MshI